MSMHPRADWTIPEETARYARASFPRGNRYLTLRDRLSTIYRDQDWEDLFSPRGRAATSPALLAMVTLLQFAENLSDRQAADAVRARLDWKYLLGLPIDYAGFDHSLLCDFRHRLLEHGAESRLLDWMLVCFREAGVLSKRGTQRSDSTHVVAAIRVLNRLELVGQSMRYVLEHLVDADREWLRRWMPEAWAERYQGRFEAYRLPKSKADRAALAEQIGADGYLLLKTVAQTPWASDPVVEVLRSIWQQQYTIEQEGMLWRKDDQLPKDVISSPYDAEARFARKRDTTWIGYKVHVTETVEPTKPQLITQVMTRVATEPDTKVTQQIHQALHEKDLLPSVHVLDSGYADAAHLVECRRRFQVELLAPVQLDTSWQAQQGHGFDQSAFVIDWRAERAICPQGQTSLPWKRRQDRYGNGVVAIRFPEAACQGCAVRSLCTRSRARKLELREEAEHQALAMARQRQQQPQFRERFNQRAGVEGTLSQLIRGCGLRTSRYIGLAKTHLQHVAMAGATNLVRVAQWLEGKPRASTRESKLYKLAA